MRGWRSGAAAPGVCAFRTPGDQHDVIANPFQDTKARISEFTASEIATLQSRLEKQLGPEYLSARSGPSGQKVHYIPAEKCIALANEVFGFNGWSSSVQNIQVDFVDENTQTGKISLGLSVIMRITLRDGTFHEDIGYGHIENCKGKAAAFEKAKKEGTTDALKRSLRNFGNVLGNCIYDKDYLSKVTKMKVTPTRFDERNLHRHSDFAKEPEMRIESKSEALPEPKGEVQKAGTVATMPNVSSVESLDDDFGDFDMADFGVTDEGHPDEVMLPASHEANSNDKPQIAPNDQSRPSSNSVNSLPKPIQPPSRALTRSVSNGNPPPRQQPYTPQPAQRAGAPMQNRPNGQQQAKPPNPPNGNSGVTTPGQANGEAAPAVGFLSARSATLLQQDDIPPGAAPIVVNGSKLFDPRAESPSIRKTPGIDHRTSKPVGRNGQHVPPAKKDEEPVRAVSSVGVAGFTAGNGAPAAAGRPSTGNVVNPALNQTRQIGAPGGASPMNRGQFRQPLKRPTAGGNGSTRTPLNEVSTNGTANAGAGAGAGPDAKRQKMG
ncbi:uncharacterized protein BCR38DRAFT_482345 [Pseudomassariella vexata]|uniref:RAD52 homolog n=1 Tax=Pseudomassariella vexata TaxID=1141098 RepID=A0A1Y2EDJ0_9PEZI|nr:uncharacterized protein BCR38DRAFT_482345 [Pseudomassariella vexata]ORY68875.1 hypothetical protein BCR38DRAFT_482345 [Pseudomassariella vexata]